MDKTLPTIKELKIQIKEMNKQIKDMKENRSYLQGRIEELWQQIEAMRRNNKVDKTYYKIFYTAQAVPNGEQINVETIIEAYSPQLAVAKAQRNLKIPSSFNLKNIQKIDV